MISRTLKVIIVIIFFTVPANADEYRSKINDGYDYYKNGEYDKAADYFGKAGVLKPDKDLPNFDKGGALYRSNDYEGAAQEYGIAIDKSDDSINKADYFYNLGNSLFNAQKYDEAIKSYVNALKLNSRDNDYKHNLELAIKQLQQQEQQQDQNQQDDQENQQDKQKQDQNQQQQSEDKKEDQQQQQQQQQDQEQEYQQSQQQAGEEQRMSEEEARNLLSRFEQDEKEIQQRLKQYNVGQGSQNDW